MSVGRVLSRAWMGNWLTCHSLPVGRILVYSSISCKLTVFLVSRRTDKVAHRSAPTRAGQRTARKSDRTAFSSRSKNETGKEKYEATVFKQSSKHEHWQRNQIAKQYRCSPIILVTVPAKFCTWSCEAEKARMLCLHKRTLVAYFPAPPGLCYPLMHEMLGINPGC